MKFRYYLIALSLSLLLQNSASGKVILDKEVFYAELDAKVDYKFDYAFQNSAYSQYKPQDKTSNYSDFRFLYLQRVYPNTQMGFNVKVGIKDILQFRTLDLTMEKIIEKLKVEEGYFIIRNKNLGSIEYGRRSMVSQSMLINTSKIYAAAGGVNGDWANYANLRGGRDDKIDCESKSDRPKKCDGAGYDKDKIFWVKPNTYSYYHGIELGLKQLVVSYIFPEVYNFQLGLSYVPGKSSLNYSNLIAGGLSYWNSLSNDIKFTTALTGEFAKGNLTNCSDGTSEGYECYNQLTHWNFGINLNFFNFDGIFSYGSGGKSGMKLHPEITDTYYTNAGVAYRSDSRKVSLTYFNSSREVDGKGKKKLTSYALSLEYPFAFGTSYYFDIVKFNTDEPEIINNNSGYVLLAGLKFSFQ
ncbi:MAG: hypothetical protein PG981_000844 [Wolbachia endosymbiont of Ctenocephalides orientis wCori]|nr:MAG: hypothetical protein PG981_000844 [Wolbachia endosymbiont of Ctenocephalides orientis wCori]